LLRPAIGVIVGAPGRCAASSAGFLFEQAITGAQIATTLAIAERTIKREQRNFLDRAMNPLVNVSVSALGLHRSGDSLWD
jgi:hypothetical protein